MANTEKEIRLIIKENKVQLLMLVKWVNNHEILPGVLDRFLADSGIDNLALAHKILKMG